MTQAASRLAPFIIVAALFGVGPALSADSGGGGGGGGGGSSGDSGGPDSNQIVCRTGFEFDKDKGICVRKKNAGLVGDEVLYAEGRALTLSGRHAEGLAALSEIREKDARTLTMMGYATRKLGDIPAGVALYDRALALDPDNAATREYLGEAYVSLGRMDLAQVQLDRIEAICGATCVHHRDLAAAMEGDEDWRPR